MTVSYSALNHKQQDSHWITRLPLKTIFQRITGVWLLILLPFSVYGPVATPTLYAFYYTILHIFFLANNSRSAYGMYVAYNSSKIYSCTNWLEKYCKATGAANGSDESHDMPYDHVLHVVILPNYKEEMETLCETLDVLASHSRAITQYKICLAMEESEADSRQKAETLMRLYTDSFYEITFTVHPKGRKNEIRGKSSNVAWAAREMAVRSGGGIQGRHSHEILTVMDADTCFAEDYFNAVAYHFCVASPEKRKIMMFAPSTVFDRNANNVPVFVRVTDMFWSIGVISNLYASSSVKIPCSAYSVSMDLAIAVDFWDAGPEAIGEDLHMYLKCFFATRGHVIVQSIFSPASQCNVEGVGSGIFGWINGFQARYTQAKRHLWGSLDTGYTMRRTLMGVLSPDSESVIHLKNASVDKYGKEEDNKKDGFPTQVLATLIHRLLEAHVLMGHLFVMITIASIFLPVRTAFSYEFAAYMWSTLSSDPIHPYVEAALHISFWLRMACLIPNVTMIFYYEMYLRWTGFERWALQERAIKQRGVHPITNAKVDGPSCYLGDLVDTYGRHFRVSDSNKHLNVQHLGKRPSLAAPRYYPFALFDWFAIPVAGFFFYVLPQFHAQLTHLFTDSLEYKVAAKPTLHTKAATPHHGMSEIVIQKEPSVATPLAQSVHYYNNNEMQYIQKQQEVSNWSNSTPNASYHDVMITYSTPDMMLHSASMPKITRSTSATTLIMQEKMSQDEHAETKSVASISSKGDEGYFEEFDELTPSPSLQDVSV